MSRDRGGCRRLPLQHINMSSHIQLSDADGGKRLAAPARPPPPQRQAGPVCVALMLLVASSTAQSHQCSPMAPTPEKIRTLTKHLSNDTAALVMWRVMKSATTTACRMVTHEYREVRHQPAKQMGTCGGPWRKVFLGQALASSPAAAGFDYGNIANWDDAHAEGYSFIGMEPATTAPMWFPAEYHRFAEPYLNPSSKHPAARARVWGSFVHLLIIRHPLERAMSAFNFKHKVQHNVVEKCKARGVTEQVACLNKCLALCEGDRSAWAFFANQNIQTANMIRSQICGNFLVEHLSHNASLQVASANLRRFSLIIDLTAHMAISTTLLQCLLGWSLSTGTGGPHANRGVAPDKLELHGLPTVTVQRMRTLMRDDLMLYDEALCLMVDHHKNALAEM